MRYSIDLNLNSEILYVGIVYKIIKYQYVNVICFLILVSFYFFVYSCYQYLHIYPTLGLTGAHMYLTSKNTVSNFTTSSSITEGENIKSNDYTVIEIACSYFESNIQ